MYNVRFLVRAVIQTHFSSVDILPKTSYTVDRKIFNSIYIVLLFASKEKVYTLNLHFLNVSLFGIACVKTHQFYVPVLNGPLNYLT